MLRKYYLDGAGGGGGFLSKPDRRTNSRERRRDGVRAVQIACKRCCYQRLLWTVDRTEVGTVASYAGRLGWGLSRLSEQPEVSAADGGTVLGALHPPAYNRQKRSRPTDSIHADAFDAPIDRRCWKHSRQYTGRPWVGLKGTVVSLPH